MCVCVCVCVCVHKRRQTDIDTEDYKTGWERGRQRYREKRGRKGRRQTKRHGEETKLRGGGGGNREIDIEKTTKRGGMGEKEKTVGG